MLPKRIITGRETKQTFINAAICQHGMSTIERTSAYGFHCGMAARKTEHVVFNCWFVCVCGRGDSFPDMTSHAQSYVEKGAFCLFLFWHAAKAIMKSVWLEQWMMGPEELQSPTLFLLSCFYSSCIMRCLPNAQYKGRIMFYWQCFVFL